MEASEGTEIIMNDDSDISDFEESEDDVQSELSEESDDDITSAGQSTGWRPAGRQPAVNAFLGWQGPTAAAHVSNTENPLDYFLLILTADVLGKVALETNRYAVQVMAKTAATPHAVSKEKLWTNVNQEEVKKFIGLIMMMGFIQKNGSVSSYWSEDQRIATPYFQSVMSKHRFQQISRYLHFNNNDELPENRDDKLYKIRPVCNLIVERWRTLYDLGEHIAIDESMMKWKRRSPFRTHQKNKPTKYGIKSYVLADAKTRYCWNMDVYHGVSKTLKETVTGLLTPQCMSLWHSLYMNGFYNSVALSEFLLEQKVYTVGTLRRNRGEPPEVSDPGRMRAGEVVARDNGKVLVLAWQGRRLARAISTKHGVSAAKVSRRKNCGRARMEQLRKPACITDYRKHMQGVNVLDQMISYYPFTPKSLKWTKNIFLHFVEISAYNAFILYKAKSLQNKFNSFYKFLLELAGQLCRGPSEAGAASDSDDERPRPPKQPRIDPADRLHGGHSRHFLALLPARASKKNVQKQCRVCRKHGHRKDTRYYCVHCGVALCVIPCFHQYHALETY